MRGGSHSQAKVQQPNHLSRFLFLYLLPAFVRCFLMCGLSPVTEVAKGRHAHVGALREIDVRPFLQSSTVRCSLTFASLMIVGAG